METRGSKKMPGARVQGRTWLSVGVLAALALGATPVGAAPKGSESKPWLIPPHILEFVGPVAQLFGTNTAFGARVQVSQADDPKGTKPAGGTFLYRNGNTIYEPDSAPVHGPTVRHKKDQDGDFGLLVVNLADKHLTYVVSEGVSGYTEVPYGRQDKGPYGVAWTDVGRDRLQGADCVKRLVVVQPDQGEAQTFVVWSAVKLRGFPLRVERTKGGPPTIFTFSDIRFEPPAENLFAQPEGYHHYESLNAMTEEMTRRVWNVYRKPEPSLAYPPADATRPGGATNRRPGSY